MGKTKYIIYLTDEEKEKLNRIIETEPPATAARAKVLLASDFANPVYCTVKQISESLGVSPDTIHTVRAEYAELGLEGAVYPKGKKAYDRCPVMTAEKKSEILDLIKEQPPYGQRRWTFKSICEEAMKRGIFPYLAPTAVQKIIHEENIDLKNPNNL